MLFNLVTIGHYNSMITELINESPNNIIIEIYTKRIYNQLKRGSYEFNGINSLSIKNKCDTEVSKRFSFIKQSRFPALTRLILSAQIKYIPRNICRLSTIIVLNLNNNMIETIPQYIHLLHSLERLYLCNNKIVSVPEDIYKLQRLTSLQLSDNVIVEFPRNLDKLPYLELLSLSGNLLSSIHPSFFKSTSITELDLSHNNIYLFNGASITTMKYLDLSNNKISQISANIYAMTRLVELDLSNNELNAISEEIDSFSLLEMLNLSDNYLHFLPKEICDLQCLKSLDLSNNAIIELPDNIGDFLSIQNLNLSNNALQELPLSIINLHNVNINITGNDEIDLDYRIAAFLYPEIELEDDIDVVGVSPNGNIYLNTENVHASSIHASIKAGILSLMEEPCTFASKEDLFQSIYGSGVFSDSIMNEINDDINSECILSSCNVSYYDILARVWARIISCVEPGIYVRLGQEITDGIGLCFVGKISRLVNSLSGFYPDINVTISDNESAGCIAQQIIARRRAGIMPIPGIDEEKETLAEIKTALEERGFSNEIITAWTNGIY